MGKNCDKLTICIRCKHYLDIPYGDCVDGIQLSSKCCAASVKKRVDNIDLVSGEEKHYNVYHYCNEINNGHCPKYEKCSAWQGFGRIDHLFCCLNVVLVGLVIVGVFSTIMAVLQSLHVIE
jgi:hypothetical protein